MCLSIEMDRPDDVLSRGSHLGFQFRVIHNGHGIRCGYVRLPAGHPWHGLSYDDIDADCHGCLTFAAHDRPCIQEDSQQADDGYWIGFDCGHAWDARDWSLPTEPGFIELIKPLDDKYPDRDRTIRTTEYVEAECRSLCEQAAKCQPAVSHTQSILSPS